MLLSGCLDGSIVAVGWLVWVLLLDETLDVFGVICD